MLEAYLFINPLCKQCIQSEKTVIKLANVLPCKFSFQFVPMLNISIIHSDINSLRKRLNTNISIDRSYQVHYNLILDIKAASFQGKKSGRKFLMNLQDQLLNQEKSYNKQLILSIAKDSNLDIKMFKYDRQSNLAKDAFKHDQMLANEMKVKSPSSAVIFDCNSSNYGILVNHINYQHLLNVCQNNHYEINNDPKSLRRNFHCI